MNQGTEVARNRFWAFASSAKAKAMTAYRNYPIQHSETVEQFGGGLFLELETQGPAESHRSCFIHPVTS